MRRALAAPHARSEAATEEHEKKVGALKGLAQRWMLDLVDDTQKKVRINSSLLDREDIA